MPRCHITYIDPFKSAVMDYYKPRAPAKCFEGQPLTRIDYDRAKKKAYLVLDENNAKYFYIRCQCTCFYRPIARSGRVCLETIRTRHY